MMMMMAVVVMIMIIIIPSLNNLFTSANAYMFYLNFIINIQMSHSLRRFMLILHLS